MKRRKKLSRRVSKKVFKRGAKRIHLKNASVKPMRGGIRL